MNNDIKIKLKDHVAHDDYLEIEDVNLILKNYPTLKYEGKAYRVLCFSQETEECSVLQDSSFAKSINGVEYYYNKQDVSYYPYAHLYEVELSGLDIGQAVHSLNIEVSKEMVSKEDEVVPFEINSQKLLFNGKAAELDKFLAKMK